MALPEKVIFKWRSKGGDEASLKIPEKKNVPDEANSKGASPSMRVCLESLEYNRNSQEVSKLEDEVKKRYLVGIHEPTLGKAL